MSAFRAVVQSWWLMRIALKTCAGSSAPLCVLALRIAVAPGDFVAHVRMHVRMLGLSLLTQGTAGPAPLLLACGGGALAWLLHFWWVRVMAFSHSFSLELNV